MVEQTVDWDQPHGTRVEIELEARYQQGRQSVDDYLQQTAIANPHVTLAYHAPDGRVETYAASVHHMPVLPKSIRPHPHGVELGVLLKMLADSKARTVRLFLTREFSRVSPRVAIEILTKANIKPDARPRNQGGAEAKAIYEAIAQTKLMAPTSDCVVPIGEEKLVSGLKQVVQAQFYAATSRKPAVYRGNPFIIEAALAYGKPESEPQPEGSGNSQTPPSAIRVGTDWGYRRRAATGRERSCPTHARAGGRGRRGERVGEVDPLRQPRAAALPAIGLRDVQVGGGDELAPVRPDAEPRGLADRPPDHRGEHGQRVGAVHERVQGGHRRLPGNPQGNPPGPSGVRAETRLARPLGGPHAPPR